MDNGASSYHRFLEGDSEGIVEIIRDYKDGLILFLNGIVHNIHVAEELVEETFGTQPVTIAARIAWHKAYEEYENHIIRQTEELLTKQGIAFERKSAIMYDKVLKCPFTDPAAEDAYMEIEISKPYLIIYISNENFASLDINYEFCVFNLADKSARDGVLPSGSYDFDLPKDAALPADS